MEDPWVNAWGDPQKSSSNNPSLTTSWTSSSKFVTDDQADIAIPSWEPDSGTIWDDSPDLHDDLWSRDNRASQLWAPPTLDSIGFAKPSQEAASGLIPHSPPPTSSPQRSEYHDPHLEGEEEEEGEGEEILQTTTIPIIHHIIPNAEEKSATPSPVREIPPVVSRQIEEEREVASREASPDADAFGTFEAAIIDRAQTDPWTPSGPNFSQIEADDWGTTWKEPDEDLNSSDTEPVDEWELAKRQKEIQDHYVPPAFLDSILRHFDEFSGDYWPGEQSEETSNIYKHNRNELAETLGITSMVERLIPSDLTLSVPTVFAKTFISKDMIEALKLTRHHAITRNSPLAVYMNTKGSLSWEAAVKSKPDVTEADVVPTGWRILPKEDIDQQQSMNDTKKKAAGGLLSFFGRRSTTNAPTSGSSSPVRSHTPIGVSPRSSTASPRPSMEANLTPPIATKPVSSSMSVKETDATPSATMSAIAEISATPKAAASSAPSEPEELVQAPSAVSRFFGRFSRSNRPSNPNPRNSIALSSDDLEFLSDIVPSANEEMDEEDKLAALSNMIRPPPVPTKLPPPLAPPPRAPPLPKPLSPPPFVDARPITPSVPISSGSPSTPMQGCRQSQLLDFDSDFLPPQPRSRLSSSQVTSTAPFTISSPQSSASTPALPPPLPPPLSPITPRSHTSNIKPPSTAPVPSTGSLFDDDDFSDFQASPVTTSAPLVSMDSIFSSFTTSAPAQTSQDTQSNPPLDDFDDFVSPPQVPEKSKSVLVQPPPLASPTPPIFPSPTSFVLPVPSIKSVSPPKQPSIHERRLSRQADSHQRALSLLETAAARGKWPAPPSPLPNAIPPPSSKSAASNLFDVFEEPNAPAIAPLKAAASSTLVSSPISSPTTLMPLPPPSEARMNGNPAGAPSGVSGFSGARNTAPMIPSPLIPTHQPMKPVPPLAQVQSQQQWRIPSPPAAKSLRSFTQPPSYSPGFENSDSPSTGGGRSDTPSQLQQQQKPVISAIPSLLTPATAPVSQTPGGSSQQNAGSSGGKLSAQDLSFFEGL